MDEEKFAGLELRSSEEICRDEGMKIEITK